jgi:nucleoside-diphosphate-sugar epimerase
MKILVLGANGFIGNALVKNLLSTDSHHVYGMDLEKNKLTESIDHRNFDFVEGDINISNEWIEYHIRKCDVIVPLVAIATPNVYVKDPLRVFELDFESNLKIVKWVAKYRKRIVFPSTSEVYGMCEDMSFDEYRSKLVVGPVHKSRWIYSCSKQLLDRVIIAYSERGDLTATLFRPFNWIGPKLDSLEQAQLGNGRVITIFINNLIHNEDIVLVNGGRQSRAFTYLDDGIDALTRIIDGDAMRLNGKIFNIGNPEGAMTIKQLAENMVEVYNELSDKPYQGKIVEKSEAEFYGRGYEDIPARVPNIREARETLGWSPVTGPEEAISRTMRDFISKKES